MKKFLIILVLLIIAAGVVFYFGWVQIRIPAASYAVIFSKIGGTETRTYKSGDFIWRWKRLIPNNLTLYIFSSSPVEKQVLVEGQLPSAETYASIMEGRPDFSFKVEFSMFLAPNPDMLPGLVLEKGLLPETMTSWYEDIRFRAADRARLFLYERIQSAAFTADTGVYLPDFEEDLTAYLQREFPEIIVRGVSPVSVLLPDFELYLIAKQNYVDKVNLHQKILLEETAALTAREASDDRRIELLG